MSYKIEYFGRDPTITLIQTPFSPDDKECPEKYRNMIKEIENKIKHLQYKLKESKEKMEKVCNHNFEKHEEGYNNCDKQ